MTEESGAIEEVLGLLDQWVRHENRWADSDSSNDNSQSEKDSNSESDADENTSNA